MKEPARGSQCGKDMTTALAQKGEAETGHAPHSCSRQCLGQIQAPRYLPGSIFPRQDAESVPLPLANPALREGGVAIEPPGFRLGNAVAEEEIAFEVFALVKRPALSWGVENPHDIGD